MAIDLLKASACDLGRMIDAQKISPTELTETYLTAIENHPLAPRIYSTVSADRARLEAAAATKRAQNKSRNSLLDGVPVSWKDLFDTKDIPTEAGSNLLMGRLPTTDATVVKNATNAGLVCLGKTHMSELAFSGLGLNPVTQTPPCINDLDAVSGGSSSGAATSVAFDLAPIAIGSDTGGSVRIPAGWNDLVGLKTTSGLVDLSGVVPLCSSFDTVGPLCRSVEDAHTILHILLGQKPQPLVQKPISEMRFAICETLALDDLETGPDQSFTQAIQTLQKSGATIGYVKVPEINLAMDDAVCLFTTEAYAQWKTEIEAQPNLMFSEILGRFRAGGNFSGVEYLQAWHRLNSYRDAYHQKTKAYDAVLMPMSPILAPNAEKLMTDSTYYIRANLLALRNTRIGNLMGLCALTLPTNIKSCGLMLCAPPNSEDHLLSVGASISGILNQ